MTQQISKHAKEILEKDRKYYLNTLTSVPLVIVKGKGAVLKDINGNEYIDCMSGTAGPLGIGYNHPKWIKAVRGQLDHISHALQLYTNIPRSELAKKIATIAPGDLRNNSMTYFSCGGSEANEVALKFAMLSKNKYEVISVYYAYHGATLALMSLFGQSWHRAGGIPRFPGFHQIPNAYCYRCFYGQKYPGCDFECARALENHIKLGSAEKNVAAFLLEPIQGNGGHMLPPSNEYFKIIRETCDKYDVLFIADEIQTGMGRTGKIWACDYFGAKPDIMTSAKALGGGMPISATIVRADKVPEELNGARAPQPSSWHIFTFGGNPLACAAANATIDIMLEEKLPEKAARQGKRITKRLKEMEKNHPLIGEVRGPGLFIGVELVKNKKTKEPAIQEAGQVYAEGIKKNVFFGVSGKPGYGNVVKIKPPLIISDKQADKVLDVLDEVLKKLER
jgi:4-aminobutyrate aminotransferase/(S)-3-amino-2-methylpropionate transaminase